MEQHVGPAGLGIDKGYLDPVNVTLGDGGVTTQGSAGVVFHQELHGDLVKGLHRPGPAVHAHHFVVAL